MSATIVWFRNDLRLADNPALTFAVKRGKAVVPVFVWAPAEEEPWAPGGAHRWWLRESLQELGDSLQAKGSRLILRRGAGINAIREIARSVGADEVVWNTRYAPAMMKRDATVREVLQQDGIGVRRFAGRVLHDPEGVRTSAGKPYTVYTPFWRNVTGELSVARPLDVPRMGSGTAPEDWPASDQIDDLRLSPLDRDGVDWAGGLREEWHPGERGAAARLERFLDDAAVDYPEARNRPDLDGTSRLSPHLHHGEISPRQVWSAVNSWVGNSAMRAAADVFLSEIGWREFSYHVLVHHPETPTEPLREKYSAMPWTANSDHLHRWQRGQTGYPIVDAGMRQLWSVGWMHNRVRMIVASFLTKHLLVPWQEGARWFWDTLVDADLANNTMGWQWSAGCGADAQPFFRIFNPITQGRKFDPHGSYVRTWIPELAKVETRHIHSPWECDDAALLAAGVQLGKDYPRPIVDHSDARRRALAAFEQVK